MKTVHIEFISDFICPWCYLGKARLERIQKILAPDIQLDIEVKPFLLYPHIPKGGVHKSHFAKKTKPGMGRSLRREAELEGIRINYRNIEFIPYSMEAHRLVWLVEDKTQQYDLAMRLFHGYFEEGQNLEDHNYLSEQAALSGVSNTVIEQFTTTDAGLAACQHYIESAKEDFVNLVPTLKLNHRFKVLGLQSPDVLEKYIRRAAAKMP